MRFTRAQTERLGARRRPLDRMEARIVHLALQRRDTDTRRLSEALRYVVSFARLTSVHTADGRDVDLTGPLALHTSAVRDLLEEPLGEATSLWDIVGLLPDLVQRTRGARDAVLRHLPVDRNSLEDEVTTRVLAIASGGGGGAGYVYPGVYHRLERAGLTPDLMVGTSMGALMSLFRARTRRYDQAPLIAAARRLSWSGIFRVLETESRYGLPASLRFYLRAALGPLFRHTSGRGLWLSDMEVPMYVITTGITVDALKHDLGYYEHFLDGDVRGGTRMGARQVVKMMAILREFLARPDALVEVVLGREEGTEDFDILDAAGFSSAIPGMLHYDVLRPDQRMQRILDSLYAARGITRLGEGGMVANVPSRVAWETIASGHLGPRRNVFVLAADCFPPSVWSPVWLPLAEGVRLANVLSDNRYADLYVPMPRTLSPANLVPSIRDAMSAMRWGREALEPHVPFIKEMMRPLPVL